VSAPSLPEPGTNAGDLDQTPPAVLSREGEPSLEELRSDLERRWRAGERRLVEEYLECWPQLCSQTETLIDLIYNEFILRRQVGETPQVEEYLQRFSGLADSLRRQFALADDPAARHPGTDSQLPVTMPERTAVPSPEPATVLAGRYELIRRLGRGGMGVVYLARDRLLNREVALKMIRSGDLAAAEERERFQREARALARVSHRHLVTVFDCGEHDGQPFFTMTYAPGGSLQDHAEQYIADPRAAAALMEKLARGIHAAHQQGLIHRDLKPGNVLFDAAGEPLVTDFGLAKLVGEEVLTRTGTSLGTPAYMAPEQVSGRPEQVGPRTDVWALGVMMFELLTGQRPFSAPSREELLAQVLQAQPPRPRLLTPRLDPPLEAITLKCLARQPGDRYHSAEALADDLDRWLTGQPVRARPESSVRKASRVLRRHWKELTAAVLAVGFLVAVFWPREQPLFPSRVDGPQLAAVERGGPDELARHGKALRDQQPAVLLGPEGAPSYYRTRTQLARPSIYVSAREPLVIEASDLALVELLPEVPLGDFRLSAEVDDRSDARGEVGLYLGHWERLGAGQREHWLAALSITDLKPKQPRRELLLLQACEKAGVLVSHQRADFQRGELPPRQDPPGWRTLTVDVAEQGLTIHWEGQPPERFALADITHAWKSFQIGQDQIDQPPAPQAAPPFARQGGLGLFVWNGRAAFRNVVVAPTP
jgi:hypothetical protein